MLAEIALIVCLVLPSILPVELSAVLMFAALALVWFTADRPVRTDGLLRFLLPLAVIVLTGFFGAYLNWLVGGRYLPIDAARDAFYLLKSILALAVGFVLVPQIKNLQRLAELVVLAGAATAIYHLGKIATDPSVLLLSLDDYREEAGRGFYLCALAIGIVAFTTWKRIALFVGARWLAWLALGLCSTSHVLSFSRTQWICLVIIVAYLFVFREFRPTARNLALVGSFVAATVLTGAVALSTPAAERSGPNATLLGKFARSIEELQIRDYRLATDLAENFRGYQANVALKIFLSSQPHELVIGRGYGYLMDMGYYFYTGDENTRIRYFTSIHNEYLNLLVKTGLIGLAGYVFFFVQLLRDLPRQPSSDDPVAPLARSLAVALCLVLLATTLVVHGLLNNGSLQPLVVLLGGCYASLLPSAQRSYSRSPALR